MNVKRKQEKIEISSYAKGGKVSKAQLESELSNNLRNLRELSKAYSRTGIDIFFKQQRPLAERNEEIVKELKSRDPKFDITKYAKGGKTQEIGFNTYETLEPNELQDLGYRHAEDSVRKIPRSIFSQPYFMEYVSAYTKHFYDYAKESKDFSVNNYAKGGYIISGAKDKVTNIELDEVIKDIKEGYGWATLDSAKQTIEIVTNYKKFNWEDKVYNKDGLVYQILGYGDEQTIIEYLRDGIYIFPTELDEKLGNTNVGFNILSRFQIKQDNSGPWATSGTSIYKYHLSVNDDFDESDIYEWAKKLWRTSIEAPISHSFELEESGGVDNNPNDVPFHGYLDERNEWVLTVKETIYYN